jgi:hypothetical protein
VRNLCFAVLNCVLLLLLSCVEAYCSFSTTSNTLLTAAASLPGANLECLIVNHQAMLMCCLVVTVG